MPNSRHSISLLLFSFLLFSAYIPALKAAELSTLFTTPEERQIINSNRYKSDEPIVVAPIVAEETIDLPILPRTQEEVVQQYMISGITLSQDGPNTVWINSIIYQDGDQLDDSSRIKVLTGDEVRVRITAPDGKHYYATSGQTLEVSYMVDAGS